ncbi:hypothetical protein M0813_22881 [Anaeramoeba flamelloides]|uniref:Uncharacterized protein n=1 Tax=Anaeramoeba flamelloides TaxID=1746091 RepID=A0ABQ8YBY6_9EUKA|nr:hypothetical protein M0813_22881 [Anaeramoeba flamelloides]
MLNDDYGKMDSMKKTMEKENNNAFGGFQLTKAKCIKAENTSFALKKALLQKEQENKDLMKIVEKIISQFEKNQI